MTTQALQDSILFQTGYLVNGIWKTLDTTFDVLNPCHGRGGCESGESRKAETEEAIAVRRKPFPHGAQKRQRAFHDPLSLV
ncbi:MAG: hypothetical protein ACLTXH_05430 [Enterobacter hormaechei]